MTNEKMLELVTKLNEGMRKDEYYRFIPDLEHFKAELLEDIRKKEAAHRNGSGKVSALKRFFKPVAQSRALFEQVRKYSDDLFTFCNAYCLYLLRDNYGYSESDSAMLKPESVNRLIEAPRNNPVEIKVDRTDLAMFIKQSKAAKRDLVSNPYIIELDTMKIGVNAQYLLDAIDVIEADYISIENPMKPIYLKNTATDEEGLVLPVRINQD